MTHLVRVLSGIVKNPTAVYKDGKVLMDLLAGTPVAMIGIISDNDAEYYVCITGQGETVILNISSIKVTIDKDLRERLAEATLTN